MRDNGPTFDNDGLAQRIAERRKANGEAPAADAELPHELDLRELARLAVDPPQQIVEGLPEGEVTLLGGHGGTGKSLILLHLCACIALGRSWYGLPTKRSRALLVSCEDGVRSKDGKRSGPLHWRLACICRWLGVEMADLDGWLRIIDASQVDAELMLETRDGTGSALTYVYEWLRLQVRDAQVLALDGASDLVGFNENNRRLVRKFVRKLRRLIPSDGAALLLAHVDKLTARHSDTSEGYSGSTQWNNSVRARWYLRRDGDDEIDRTLAGSKGDAGLILELQKANHARDGTLIRLRWNDSAHLFVADEIPPVGKLGRALQESDERATVARIVAEADAAGDPIPTAKRGDRTGHEVATARGGLPGSLVGKRGRTAFYAHLEALRAGGAIWPDAMTRPNRHKVEVYRPRRAAPATDRAPATERSAPATDHSAPATEH